MAAATSKFRGIRINFPHVLPAHPSIHALALLLIAAAPALRAQEAVPVDPAPAAVEAQAGPVSSRGGVFKANEAMLIEVPLDTSSVLNGAFPIDSAGYVTLPVAGRLFVHDKDASEIESYLAKRMSQYLRDTHIIATPVVRLTLIGHWQRPGMHYVDPQSSVWEACRVAGGPAGEQNIHKWRVMRGGEILPISLLDEFSKGSSLRAAGVRSGDLFIIPQPDPQSGFWYWFRESLTVTAEIAAIVGTTLTAYLTYLALDERR